MPEKQPDPRRWRAGRSSRMRRSSERRPEPPVGSHRAPGSTPATPRPGNSAARVCMSISRSDGGLDALAEIAEKTGVLFGAEALIGARLGGRFAHQHACLLPAVLGRRNGGRRQPGQQIPAHQRHAWCQWLTSPPLSALRWSRSLSPVRKAPREEPATSRRKLSTRVAVSAASALPPEACAIRLASDSGASGLMCSRLDDPWRETAARSAHHQLQRQRHDSGTVRPPSSSINVATAAWPMLSTAGARWSAPEGWRGLHRRR